MDPQSETKLASLRDSNLGTLLGLLAQFLRAESGSAPAAVALRQQAGLYIKNALTGKTEERYASTIHDFQGRDTSHMVYIDPRYMFQIEQLYTAVSRAKAIEQLVLLTPGKPEPPSEPWQSCPLWQSYRLYPSQSPQTPPSSPGYRCQ